MLALRIFEPIEFFFSLIIVSVLSKLLFDPMTFELSVILDRFFLA